MFRSPFDSPFSQFRFGLVRGISTACLVLALVTLLGGCGSKRAETGNAAIDPDAPVVTDGVDDGRYVINPNKQIRWHYEVLPNPNPSSKPNYLLKSYTCAQASAALNNEARGSVADLVEMLQAKPSIRVVCVGLCDGQKEKANAENLGMNRAQGARQYLISRGIAKSRIEMASFGATQAKAPAGESIGQGLDRKVEIWLLTE